jgi:hypothetical protein
VNARTVSTVPLLLSFVFLQLVDFLTTVVGLKWGAQELNPFIQHVMRMGPLEGLLACKLIILMMGSLVIWYQRHRVILVVNYLFAVLVVWNLSQLLKIPVV